MLAPLITLAVFAAVFGLVCTGKAGMTVAALTDGAVILIAGLILDFFSFDIRSFSLHFNDSAGLT